MTPCNERLNKRKAEFLLLEEVHLCSRGFSWWKGAEGTVDVAGSARRCQRDLLTARPVFDDSCENWRLGVSFAAITFLSSNLGWFIAVSAFLGFPTRNPSYKGAARGIVCHTTFSCSAHANNDKDVNTAPRLNDIKARTSLCRVNPTVSIWHLVLTWNAWRTACPAKRKGEAPRCLVKVCRFFSCVTWGSVPPESSAQHNQRQDS